MIDYSYLREVIYNRRLLTDEQNQGLRHALWYTKYSQVGYRNDYLDNLGFVIHSEDTFMTRYCRCGESGGLCEKRSWCSRCAYAEATALWKEYLLNYDSGRFHFLTVSIIGTIPFTDANASDLIGLWRILTLSLQVLRHKLRRSVQGMLVSEEVSVRQFLPILINPHVHAVVDSDDPMAFYEALKPVIDGFLARHASGYALQVSVKTRAITNQSSFKAALRYLSKPINIKRQYRIAWDSKVMLGLHPAWALNSETKDFIRGTSHVSHTPKTIQHLKRFGSLNGKSANFLGRPEARRNDHWDAIKAIPLSDDQWANYDQPGDA